MVLRKAGSDAAMQTEGFSFVVEQLETGALVRVTGDVDIDTAPRLDKCLIELESHPLTLDLSRVTYMDSSAIAVLVKSLHRAARNETSFAIRGVQPEQQCLLEITGLFDLLNIDGD